MERVKIGIPGFSNLVPSGIEKGTTILLSGTCGTGKTTLGLQFIHDGARKGEKGLFVSFDEQPKKIKERVKSFGWDFGKLEKDGLVRIVEASSISAIKLIHAHMMKKHGILDIELEGIPTFIPSDFKPDRMVIDSLSSLSSYFIGEEEKYRLYLTQLFKILEDADVTCLGISETPEEGKYSRSGIKEFLADGVIILYNSNINGQRVRAIEILKLRGTEHATKIVPFKIINKRGVEIYPDKKLRF